MLPWLLLLEGSKGMVALASSSWWLNICRFGSCVSSIKDDLVTSS